MDIEENNKTDQSSSPELINSLEDLLGNIKNDNGDTKYSSVEEALRGAAKGQEFIRTLKEESAVKDAELQNAKEQLRLTLEQLQKMEETNKSLLEFKQSKEGYIPNMEDKEDNTQVVDIDQKILAAINQMRQTDLFETNKAKVKATLLEKFGENAPSVFRSLSALDGMTDDELIGLAARYPNLILKSLDAEKKVKGLPLKSSVNIESLGDDDVPLLPKPTMNHSKAAIDRIKQLREETKKKLGIE